MCTAYWPPFALLCDQAKKEWKGAILDGYYFAALEPAARAYKEECAVRAFALATEIELKRVFNRFKKEVSEKPDLQKAASDMRGNDKTFSKYLTDQGRLTLGDMKDILNSSRAPQQGILKEFRAWLLKSHRQMFDIDKHLEVVSPFRNRASHEGLTEKVMERVHEACRAIINGVH